MFLGLASVLYIIQDTAHGPSSDLRAFEKELKFLPAQLWMYIWLTAALGILALNARMLWHEDDSKDETPPKNGKKGQDPDPDPDSGPDPKPKKKKYSYL